MKKHLLPVLFLGAISPILYAQETPVTPTPAPVPAQSADAPAAHREPGFISSEDLQPVDPQPINPPVSAQTPETTAVPHQELDPGVSAVGTDLNSGLGAVEETSAPVDPNARTARDFQDAEVAQVLRLLARQAKINMVVSSKIQGTLTMRLESTTAMEAIRVVITAQGLTIDEIDNVFYVKTSAERADEPTVSGNYTLSYARGKSVEEMLAKQFPGMTVQTDERTNTVFYRVGVSQVEGIKTFLDSVDIATKQVMIEARLVEVSANPKQSYGINWAGVVGGAASPQTFRYGGSPVLEDGKYTFERGDDGNYQLSNMMFGGETNAADYGGRSTKLDSAGNIIGTVPNPINDSVKLGRAVAGQFAILSLPQMSATLRLLNEDSDAEFLANPRVVTADNQEATIKIIRSQPIPQLNFNEQTATAVFGGFEEKEFGNTLVVKPSINKDNFINLSVKPEISNKVGDEVFQFASATVRSPVIDTRSLDSNVLIRSGNTLAIGGLLQDESLKGATKVPVLGDIPVVGYLFQEKLKSRNKRNLLVFVTPTIIGHGEGTGLEDQINGLHDVGNEYADPNGWRNNAKGAIQIVPTSNRQIASEYPVPGTPLRKVSYKGSAPARER